MDCFSTILKCLWSIYLEKQQYSVLNIKQKRYTKTQTFAFVNNWNNMLWRVCIWHALLDSSLSRTLKLRMYENKFKAGKEIFCITNEDLPYKSQMY